MMTSVTLDPQACLISAQETDQEAAGAVSGISRRREDESLCHLVEEAKAGCRESFDALMSSHHERVFNYILRLCGNRQDAEDLTQETFIKVFRNLHRHRRNASFAPWLFTIAKRTALNHFRTQRSTLEFGDYHEFDHDDPSRQLERKEHSENFWRLTRRLKPIQQEALWLRYGEGFSIEETARILKRNKITVRVILHRARGQLAQAAHRFRSGSIKRAQEKGPHRGAPGAGNESK